MWLTQERRKMRTASWENVNKPMPPNMKLHMSMFYVTESVDKMTSHRNTQYSIITTYIH